jgi:hypothetical protein
MDIFSKITNENEQLEQSQFNLGGSDVDDSIMEQAAAQADTQAALELLGKLVAETSSSDPQDDELWKLLQSFGENPSTKTLKHLPPKISVHSLIGPSGPAGDISQFHSPLSGANGGIIPPTTIPSSNSTTIITAPDGEQYFTDGSGLFVNVKDVENADSFGLDPKEFVKYSVITVDESNNDKSQKAFIAEKSSNSPEINIDIFIHEGQEVLSVDLKSIFDSYTLLGQDVFDIKDICIIAKDPNKTVSCKFYTPKHDPSEPNGSEPSSHYKFDTLPKYNSNCSSPTVILAENTPNPSCKYANSGSQYMCKSYIPETWEDHSTTVAIAQIDNQEVYTLQSRRHGLGILFWRVIKSDNEVVQEPTENLSLIKAIYESQGFTGFTPINPEEKPLDTYSQYVASV